MEENQIEDLKSRITTHLNEISNLTTNLNNSNLEIDNLKTQLQNALNEKNDLNTKNIDISLEKDKQIELVISLEEEKSNLLNNFEMEKNKFEKEINDLLDINKQLERKIDNINSEKENLEIKTNELKQSLESCDKERDSLKNRLQSVESINLEHQSTINNLSKERNKAKNESDTTMAEFKAKENKFLEEKFIFEEACNEFKQIIIFYDRLSSYEKEKLNSNKMGLTIHKENLRELLKTYTLEFTNKTKDDIKEFIQLQKSILNKDLEQLEQILETIKAPLLSNQKFFNNDKIHQSISVTLEEIKIRKDEVDHWDKTIGKI